MKKLALFLYLFLVPFLVHAAALININTADAALLDTLPGIGPSKAAAIVTYRTDHGPFATIEDIQNVSGIGPSTFADIEALITVGDTTTTSTAPVASTTASTTAATSSSSGSSSPYLPPPSDISIAVFSDEGALTNVPVHFWTTVRTKGGALDAQARIRWSFGDGSSAEGSEIEKTYRHEGTYVITATVTDGSARATDELVAVVTSAHVRIPEVTTEGVVIENDAAGELDLSGWRLIASTGIFKIPEGMRVLPGHSILLSWATMNLSIAFGAALTYPDGTSVTLYQPSEPASSSSSTTTPATSPSSVMQPALPDTGLPKEQATIVTEPAHADEQALAPAATTQLAAAGAAFADAAAPSTSPPTEKKKTLFSSPWSWGLGGLLVISAGAFILL